MKKIIFLILTFLLTLNTNVLFGQTEQVLENTTQQSIQTPSVASLGQHGELPVNLYTGSVSYSLPISTLRSSVTDINISISYNSSGIRVDDKASTVGLGWSLNAGGMITRTAQSYPEDKYERKGSGYYENVPGVNPFFENINDGWDTFEEVASGNHSCNPGDELSWDLKCKIYLPSSVIGGEEKFDSKPDIYTYNFNGLSGKFLIPNKIEGSSSGFATSLPENNLLIEWYSDTDAQLSKFIVIDDRGTEYTFNLVETVEETSATRTNQSSLWEEDFFTYRYASSWFLTEIASPYSTDEKILFTYQPHTKTVFTPAGGYYLQGDGVSTFFRLNKSKNIFNSFLISEIKTNSKKATFLYNDKDFLNDVTLSEKTLKQIDIVSDSLVGIASWELQYEHFISRNDINTGSALYNAEREAKLVSVQQLPSDVSAASVGKYKFEYLNDDLHRLPYNYQNDGDWYDFYANNGIDYWGFYTGRNQTNSPSERGRIPILAGFTNPVSGLDWLFADMRPDAETIKYGLLKKIIYPTGGFTELDYEIADFSWVGDKNLLDVDLGIDLNEAATVPLYKLVRTTEQDNLLSTTFEIVEQVEAYFESRVLRRFYSSNRPCNFEPGHGISKLEKVDGSQSELISSLEVTLDPYDSSGTGSCDGIATGSASIFYPAGSGSDETVRFTLEPGTYTITTELECCDDLANNISRESVYIAESWLRYDGIDTSISPPDYNNFTSYNEMISFLGQIREREAADLINFENEQGGGVRIKSIRNHANDSDSNPMIRKFVYKETNAGGETSERSSGVLVRKPEYRNSLVLTDENNEYLGVISRLQTGSFMPLSTTHGSVVGYREVTELYGENGEFGKNRYVYSSPVEVPDFNEIVFENQLFTSHIITATQDWARGKQLKSQLYSSSNELIQSEEFSYEFVMLKEKPKLFPGVELRTLSTNVSSYSESNCGGSCRENINLYYTTVNVHTTGFMNVAQTIKSEFRPSGEELVTKTNYDYYQASSQVRLLRSITETNSDNEIRKTNFEYAHEVTDNGNGINYTPMASINMLSQPYSVTISNEKGDVVDKSWTLWNNDGEKWRPGSKWVWIGGDPQIPVFNSNE